MSVIIHLQLILLLTCLVVSFKLEDKSFNDLAKSRGLYGSDTKVIVLNATNLKKTIYGTSNAWLVEFYNSWCGFCQRFAPVWTNLAADVHDWQDVVKIAAIDCADDDNNPLCREYEIMHYPSLRFFPADSKVGILGTEVEKGKSEEDIRHNLVQLLKKEQLEGRGSSWPNIIPYRSSDVLNLWKNVPETTKFAFLIFEEKESYIGTEVILDLYSIKNIQIRRVINENEALSKLMGVFTFPSLVVLERNQNIFLQRVREDSRGMFGREIKSFLEAHNIILPEKLGNPIIDIPSTKSTVSTKQEGHEENAVEQFGDVVFQVDLESTLQYSLKSEIPMHKFISARPLDALKKYLTVLAKYFPIGGRGKEFLEKLKDKIQDLSTLKGQMFLEIVENLEADMKPVFPNSDGWLGCKGSVKRFRGYPCGLWTMFHTLTTNSLIENGNDVHFNNLEVLDAMLGYITHFFGCQECSRHFQEMAEKSMRQNVTSPEESVLWLWSAHNMVNKRLAGDVTEDPLHPKVQFPTQKACPACRGSDGRWVREQVLAYLKQMYSQHSIVHVGLESRPVANIAKPDTIQVQGKLIGVNLSYKQEGVDRKKLGWNFNIFDISLCVVLYAGSAVILILVFIKFIVRKRYRKKAYIHDLLGKV